MNYIIISMTLILLILEISHSTSGLEYKSFLNDCDEFYRGKVDTYLSQVATIGGPVQIDVNLLCKLSIKDYRVIKPEYEYFISEISNLSNSNSDSFFSVITNPSYEYLDGKNNFGELSSIEKDVVRSNILSSLGSIFINKSGKYEDYHSTIVRNTFDYFLGFIIQNYTYYVDILPSSQVHISKNLELYYKMLNLEFKSFQAEDYKTGPRVIIPNISSMTYDSDYLDYIFVSLRTRFLDLKCGAASKYIALINDLASYFLYLQMRYDIFDWPRYSNLKFDTMYAPDINSKFEILNWIGLGLDDITIRLSRLEVDFYSHYSQEQAPDEARIIDEILRLESLTNEIFTHYATYQNSYYIYLRHRRLSTRYYRDSNRFNHVPSAPDIC